MSLILATQDESDTPYNFINHFQNTLEIKPNSSIALNHITVNREFLLDFDEDKVFFVSHSRALPAKIPYNIRSVDPTLGGEVNILTDKRLLPFVGYPMPVIIPRGTYGIETFRKMLEYRLNNPTSRYGGDYWVTGSWTISTIEDAVSKETIGFNFDWNSNTNHLAAAIPGKDQVVNWQSSFTTNWTYTPATGTVANTGGAGIIYDCCASVDGFVSTDHGHFTVDCSKVTKNALVGLVRHTDGNYMLDFGMPEINYQSAVFMGFKPEDLDDQFTQGYNFYDYVLHIDDAAKVSLYQLQIMQRLDGNAGLYYYMEEVEYWTDPKGTGAAAQVTNAALSVYDFGLNGDEVRIDYSTDGGKTFNILSHGQLKPLNNFTCQMIPKITLKEPLESVNITAVNLVNRIHDPVDPFLWHIGGFEPNPDVAFPSENLNTFWAFMWINQYPRIVVNPTNTYDQPVTSNCFMRDDLRKYMPFDAYSIDYDAQVAMPPGKRYTVTDTGVGGAIHDSWWAFDYTAVGQFFDFNFQNQIAAKDYIFPGGNNIISYNCLGRFFNCLPTTNNCLGIPRPFFNDVEFNAAGNFLARIVGDKDFATTANDILYIRVNIGDTLTANGATSSLSKIISPIVATGENAPENGIRTYLPTERLYLKLHNTNTIFMNNIRVEIVTDKERWARELAGTTSCSFHIIEDKDVK